MHVVRVRKTGYVDKAGQAVSGYWHTLTTLAEYCRVRSYLLSARSHAALTGNPWLPTPATA